MELLRTRVIDGELVNEEIRNRFLRGWALERWMQSDRLVGLVKNAVMGGFEKCHANWSQSSSRRDEFGLSDDLVPAVGDLFEFFNFL